MTKSLDTFGNTIRSIAGRKDARTLGAGAPRERVLRPGGIELTRQMLDGLEISSADTAIEFAPLGLWRNQSPGNIRVSSLYRYRSRSQRHHTSR